MPHLRSLKFFQAQVLQRFRADGAKSQAGFERIKYGEDLRTLHAGETFQKILNGLAGLEMGEETLHRHARAFEDQRAAEDFRVGMVSAFFAHGGTMRPFDFSNKVAPVNFSHQSMVIFFSSILETTNLILKEECSI